jgi:hypothetical protein
MTDAGYRYELRRGNEIIATGHLTWEHRLETGDEIAIGGRRGIVETIEPLLSSREQRLVVQVRDRARSSEG